MQKVFVAGLLAASVVQLQASTLLQLSLDDMIRKSTSIVRGKAQRSYSAPHGSMIYTHYQVQVSETLKGTQPAQVDLYVPGGIANGIRQTYAGSPDLASGQDYVLFLWTSKSGVTQVIGLSQGLFTVTTNASGQPLVVRGAVTETILDANGQSVTDSGFQMLLSDLRARIKQVLAGKVGP